jgi:hypothetical protein
LDVDFAQFIDYAIGVDVLLRIEVDFFEGSFDFIGHTGGIILLKDVAFEVVFVVGFPGFAAHIAKALPTDAGHEIAALRSLNCFITPRTELGVGRDPLSIGLFFEYNVYPPHAFITGTR